MDNISYQDVRNLYHHVCVNRDIIMKKVELLFMDTITIQAMPVPS